MKLDVLTVCTGNICRSPAAERLLAARTGLSVRSAGTHAVVGAPVSAPMAALLDEARIATAGFAARQLSAELLTEPALVLTMTREHRSAVVELDPGALGRTFTLQEFARLAAGLPAAALAEVHDVPGPRARLESLVAAVRTARARAAVLPGAATGDDITDPYGRPPQVYAEVYTQISAAVATLTRLLAEPPPIREVVPGAPG